VNKAVIPVIIILAVGIPTAYALTITFASDVVITGFLDMSNNKISNVGSPTLSPDVATKGYVDFVESNGSPTTIDASTLDGTDSTSFLTKPEHDAIVECNNEAALAFTIPAFTPSSSCLPNIETLDGTSDSEGTSIAIGTDGFPVISYTDTSIPELKFVHCTSVNCSTADTPLTLEASGEFSSITIGTDGFPAVSYHDDTNTNLKFVHCTSVNCSTRDTPLTLDSDAGNVGRFSSIAIGTDGFPVISYEEQSILVQWTSLRASFVPSQ